MAIQDETQQFIIMLPPIRKFPESPKDQPGCIEIICPHCKKEAWISKKKRDLRLKLKKCTIICYDCLEDLAIKGFFKNSDFRKVIL